MLQPNRQENAEKNKSGEPQQLQTRRPGGNGQQRAPGTNGHSPVSKGTGYAFTSETNGQMMQIRRTDRLRRAVNLTCQAIIRSYDEDAILSECCRFLVDEAGYQIAWVGLSTPDEPGRIVPKAHAGMAVAMEDLDRLGGPIESLMQKTANRCVEKRTPQMVRPQGPDGATAQRHDLDATTTICTVPIEIGPHGQGVLALRIDDPEAFKAEEVALLRELANDLGHGISMLHDKLAGEEREERLLHERDFHDAILRHAKEGIFVATLGGRLKQANPAFARLLGHRDEEALMDDRSVSLYTILTPQDKNRLLSGLEEGKRDVHEVTMRRKDSASIPVKVTVRTLQSPEGLELLAFVEDRTAVVTQQVKNAEFTAMLDAVGKPVFKVDKDAEIEYWNDAAEARYGLQEKKVLGSRYPDVLINGHKDREDPRVAEAIQEGRSLSGIHIKRQSAQGKTLETTCSVRPVVHPDGRHTGSLVVEEETASSPRAPDQDPAGSADRSGDGDEAASSSSKLDEGLTYSMKTAMTPILNHAELLADHLPPQDERRRNLEVIRKNAGRVAKLLHAMDASHQPARNESVPTRPTKIHEVLDQAVDACAQQAQEKGIELVRNQSPSTVVDLDPEGFRRAIMGILGNAISDTPGGAPVKIRASRTTRELRFSITDSGRRVTDKELHALLESPDDKPHGQPSGNEPLWDAKRIIEQHEGRIWVEHAPGKGKTIYFTLPTDRTTSALPPLERVHPETDNQGGPGAVRSDNAGHSYRRSPLVRHDV